MHASQQNLIFSTTLVCVFFFSYCNSQFRCSTFPGACVEQRYQVPGRLGVLSLSVLNSDDEKLSLKSVLLMSSKTSRVKSYQWLKTLLSHSTVACDVDTISVSSKSPSHDTGDALKKSRGTEKQVKKAMYLLLSRWQSSQSAPRKSNSNVKTSELRLQSGDSSVYYRYE